MAFSPDGSLLATNSFDGTARVWDTSSGEELLNLENDNGPGFVAFSPDGSLLATSNVYDHLVRVYVLDLEQLKALAQARVTRSLTTEECQKYLHMDECPPMP